MVYKLEISKERMLSALTHSGVWSLFQALLMTKYAMNLGNLQPCGGGKLLSGLPLVFVCLSDSPLDLLCAKFPLHSRAVAQVCSLKQECSLAWISFWKTLLLSSLCIHKHELSLFCCFFFPLAVRAFVVYKLLKYHLQSVLI